jgi:hypothetical protein
VTAVVCELKREELAVGVAILWGFLEKEEELEGDGEVDKESKRVPHSLKGRDIMMGLQEELRKYQRVRGPESYSVVILLTFRIPRLR